MDVKEPAPKYFPKMSPSEFLVWERAQEFKHEYVNGEVLAMSSASFKHNQISTNIIRTVSTHLRGKDYNILPADLRVSVRWHNSFFYPDATIVCGDPEFDDEKMKDTLANPAVVFEILSPSTENYDIGRKLMYYMQIKSLQQYIIIDSQKIYARVITRREEERTWKFDEFDKLEDKVLIVPISFTITLADFYTKV